MDLLVSTRWLSQMLGQPDLIVLDASLHLPGAQRDARAEFRQGHIARAQFLDLAALHDPQSGLPGKIPDSPRVKERLAELGIGPDSRIVLYDDSALRTACRAWYLLDLHGVRNVAVLDGGFGKWQAESLPVEGGESARVLGAHGAPGPLGPDRGRIRSKAEMFDAIAVREEQIVDARDAARFRGDTKDTVHDLPGGHIPGSKNVPFASLFAEDGTFLEPPRLAAIFRAAGIEPEQPIVASCGSGVTAAVLVFALALMGSRRVSLYDGSWAEWGADPSTPKEQGPAS